MIVGIDEVGRGAWAGPLVVGAVLLGPHTIAGLTDSKKLTKKQRTRLDLEIRQTAKAVGLGWVSAKQIDALGLSEALKLGARRALGHIKPDFSEIIIDGTTAFIDDERVTTLAKADLLIPSVSAASIVAKVARDTYMSQLDGIFEGYSFTSHVGYGTLAHRMALEKHGPTPLHRLSFEPLRAYRPVGSLEGSKLNPSPIPSTKVIGDGAETAVAEYLRKHGHAILDRNWRTKRCEIDIVSRKEQTLYFTEVKYRKSDRQGGGLAAITSTKLRQMTYAAENYMHRYGIKETDARLAAVDVTGEPPKVVRFLEIG